MSNCRRGLPAVASAIIALCSLAGCQTPQPPLRPQILTIGYVNLNLTRGESDRIIDDASNGRTTVAALLTPSPGNSFRQACNFTADFSGARPSRPHLMRHNPFVRADPRLAVSITAQTPANLTTTNPASCDVLREFEFDFGGVRTLQKARIGERTAVAASVVLANAAVAGFTFDGPSVGTGVIDSFADQSPEYAIGEFDFIIVESLPNNRVAMLIGEGHFSMTPQ